MGNKADQKRDAAVRSEYGIGEERIWHGPGGWVAYGDGLITVKMQLCSPEPILLQDVVDFDFKDATVMTRGRLRFSRAADTYATRQQVLFTKADQAEFAELRDMLKADQERGVKGELPTEYGPEAAKSSIRAEFSVPETMSVHPGSGKHWVAYGDGVIALKSGAAPVITMAVQDVLAVDLDAAGSLAPGTLRFSRATDRPKGGPAIFFDKQQEADLVTLTETIRADQDRGVAGEPAGLQDTKDPSIEMEDQAFRAKYRIPADAVLARSPWTGYVCFDGHFVTIQHLGLGRVTVGKGVKRIPLTAISSVQVKPTGSFVSGFIQFSLAGGNEVRSKFGKQTWDATDDENTMVIRANEPDFLTLRDAIEQAQRQLHAPRAAAPAAVPDDVFAQLEKLGKLRDGGILTEAEFEVKKAELLTRM